MRNEKFGQKVIGNKEYQNYDNINIHETISARTIKIKLGTFVMSRQKEVETTLETFILPRDIKCV